MNKHWLNRRQFSVRCAAFGLSFPASSAILQASRCTGSCTGAQSQPAAHTVKLPDGTTVPALGQGCWHLGQGRHPEAVEEEALRTGISLGMTLIDTSGNYGNGRSEEFISHVIAGAARAHIPGLQGRGRSGVWRWHRACLRGEPGRLRTDYLDLYLLHWPVPSTQFPGVVAAFEKLRAAGKIRAWGVSNFNVEPDGGSVPCSGRQSLRDQSGALQSQQPSH